MDLSFFMCSGSAPVDNTFSNSTATAEADYSTSTSSTRRHPPELLESSCSSSASVHDCANSVPSSTAAAAVSTVPAASFHHDPLSVKPGQASPSSLSLNRRLSAGIATADHDRHPVLEGRPLIITQSSSLLSKGESASSLATQESAIVSSPIPASAPPASYSSTSSKRFDRAMAVPVAPNSAPARPEHVQHRSVSEIVQSSLSMFGDLPFSGNKHEEDEDEEVFDDSEETKTATPSSPNNSFSSSSSPSKPILRRSQTSPAVRHPTTYRFDPPPLRTQAWSEPPGESFQIRGKHYMKDRIKVPSAPSAFRLFAVDVINTEQPMYSGMCAHPEERIQKAIQRELETGVKELPEFVFCVNLCVPGTVNYHSAYYWGVDKSTMEEIRNMTTPFGRLMYKFLYGGSDEFRDRTFKLIPRIVEGNYIVRRAVGTKPTILGRKIKQYYISTERYMEVLVDISSDSIAQRITKLCFGYLQSMVVDMMFLLEGNDEKELPERIFGGVRLKGVDFNNQDGKRTVPLP